MAEPAGARLALLDLDGVICDDRHRVQYALCRDWGMYFGLMEGDRVWARGRELYDACTLAGWDIAYLTGRREDTRRTTRRWLKAHGFDHHAPLLMRGLEDRRKLPELKAAVVAELLGQACPRYREVVLYDDDPLVIEQVGRVAGARVHHCRWHIKHQRLVERGQA